MGEIASEAGKGLASGCGTMVGMLTGLFGMFLLLVLGCAGLGVIGASVEHDLQSEARRP